MGARRGQRARLAATEVVSIGIALAFLLSAPGCESQAAQDPARHAGANSKLGTELALPAVKDSTGKEFRWSDLRRSAAQPGKIAVLTFWCTTCHSCRVIEGDFDAKAKAYADKGVVFAMVDSTCTDDDESVNRFLAQRGLGFPVLMDPESDYARYFGTRLTTTTAVIDADGRLRYFGGFPKAEDAVANLLAGVEVAVPETKGFG